MDKVTRQKSLYGFLAKLAFELLAVIAGILIALFVNHLQERKRDNDALISTLSSLSSEFEENIRHINNIQSKLEHFRDTLTFYENVPSLTIYDLTVKAPGLTTAELFTTNWQTALSNNSVRLLGFEIVTMLSQIDAKHKELRDQESLLNAIQYTPALFKTGKDGIEYKKVLRIWLGGYMGNEQELMALYKKFDELILKFGAKAKRNEEGEK